MPFDDLTKSAVRLRTLLHHSTGRHLIADVSLEGPGPGNGEADFIKLVLWSYVFWFEACQPAGRHLTNIVRNSSPEGQKLVSRATQDVQNLRTYHAHNLLTSNKGDQYKKSQAKAWLSQNGGSEGDWGRCSDALCSAMSAAVETLCNHWVRLTASPEDAETAKTSLIDAIERAWEPHLFDRIVEDIASSLQLSDFDVVKYRQARLNDWQKIVDFFLDRTSAEAAIRRAIHQELSITFGFPED